MPFIFGTSGGGLTSIITTVTNNAYTSTTAPTSAVATTGRLQYVKLVCNPLVNASVSYNSVLGAITGGACTNNAGGGTSAGVAWNTTFGAMLARITCTAGGVANALITQQYRPLAIDLVRLMEADPAYSTMPRARWGTAEFFGYFMLDAAGPFAGTWSTRLGIFAPRNTALGAFGQGIVFYANETSPNWRAAIEVKGNPETTQLLLVDVDTGIPFQQQILNFGIRCGAISETSCFVDWLINGTIVNQFTGTIATRFQNVGPTAQESMCPGFSITKSLAIDPVINLFLSSAETMLTPGIPG